MKKLTLHKETLRRLAEPRLGTVHGGDSDGETLCQACNTVAYGGDTLFCPNHTQIGQTICQECEM